jgi:hypothetical protein
MILWAKTLLQIVGIIALMIVAGALRAKWWQDRGGSAVFFTKQKFQSLFNQDKDDKPEKE